MDIQQDKHGHCARFILSGRLDALTAAALRTRLNAAMEAGARELELDMAGVGFMSSAGIRVLQELFTRLTRIKGSLRVLEPSPFVREMLEVVGLYDLLGAVTAPAHPEPSLLSRAQGGALHGTLTRLETEARLNMARVPAGGADYAFPATSFCLGFGTLGLEDSPPTAADCGTLVAAGGYAAYACPVSDYVADYMIYAPEFVPRIFLLEGVRWSGDFAFLLDFAAVPEEGVGFDDLGRWLLEATAAEALGLVLVGEAGAVAGERLRSAPDGDARPLADPLALTDGALLAAGWIRRRTDGAPGGACHAAVFQAAPLRKGPQRLTDAVTALFELPLLEVLRLLPATRFRRGVVWLAPLDRDRFDSASA